MAISWTLDISEHVEFDEFIAFFQAQGAHLFETGLDESAVMMRKIANNRRFVAQRLNDELAAASSLKAFQGDNPYAPHVFTLHTSKTMLVRLCLWNPARSGPSEKEAFSYEIAHDHNFELLTVGYQGSGYRTRIHEYDRGSLVGYEGEPVRLRCLEETTLPFGKVIFFRKGIDVHTQHPPVEQSISLNVVKREASSDQYSFDVEAQRVRSKVDHDSVGTLIGLAGIVGDGETVDLLARIAATSECRRARLAAYEAVSKHRGREVWERATNDVSELVRVVARAHLD